MSAYAISAIGILAGTFTTVSFTPQLLLWYGLLIVSLPVILALKLRHDERLA